jgi:hypothetical protein
MLARTCVRYKVSLRGLLPPLPPSILFQAVVYKAPVLIAERAALVATAEGCSRKDHIAKAKTAVPDLVEEGAKNDVGREQPHRPARAGN